MKKKKSRLIVSLLTAFIMAFTVIPFMGHANEANAATGDTVTFTFTPTINNPISKVVLTQQSNGNYKVQAAAKCTLYDSYKANGKAVNVSFFDADKADAGKTSGLVGYGISQNGDDYLYKIAGTGVWTEIEPGQTVRLGACAYYDYYYENSVGAPVWYDDTKGYKAKSQYAVTFTAPCATHSYSGGVCTVCGVVSGDLFKIAGERTKDVKAADKGQVIWSRTFKADSLKILYLEYNYVKDSGYAWPADGYFVVTGNSVGVIHNSNAGDKHKVTFDKADTYTVEFKSNYISSGTVAWTIDAELVKKYVPSNKYKTCTMTKLKDSAPNSHYVQIEAKNLDYKDPTASVTSEQNKVMQSPIHIYRFCGNTVKLITVLEGITSRATSTSYKDYATLDKTYSYYVIKKCMVDKYLSSAKLPTTKGSSITLTTDQRTALTTNLAKYGNKAVVAGGTATTITMPKPTVATVKDFKLYVHKDVPKYRRLMWDNNSNGGVTGYIVKRYNSSGKLIKNYGRVEMSAPDTIGKARKYYVPYSSDPDKYTAYFTVTPYYKYNGNYYNGKETSKLKTKSVRIKAPTAKITKISNSKAKITINKASNSAGTIIYQYTGGKWKKIGSTTGTKYTVTYNKSKGSSKTPGKAQYKFKSYLKDNGTTFYSDSYSAKYSPKANNRSWNYSKYQSDYKDYSHFWKPIKIYYSNGKVKLTGRWINTHNYRLDYFNIKVTVKCDGKVIGTKTLKCGKMAANRTKTHSAVTISTKAGYDLRNGNTTITYKVISWY